MRCAAPHQGAGTPGVGRVRDLRGRSRLLVQARRPRHPPQVRPYPLLLARSPSLGRHRGRADVGCADGASEVVMRCDRCAAAAPVLKTLRWRDRNGCPFVLCDPCWLPISSAVWIVPGPVVCFGRCSGCGEWVSVRALEDLKPGGAGRGDAPGGTCTLCGQEV